MELFINKNYFKILHEYDSLEISNQKIQHLQLFQKDKIICLFNNYIEIYNIFEKKLLCKKKIYNNIFYYEGIREIKTFGNDKFIVYNVEGNEYTEEDLRLFLFEDNRNNYSCKELLKISEKANNILIEGTKLICIKKRIINIYILIKDNIIQLQSKIVIPQIIDKYSFNKGFFMKKNKLKIIEYRNKYIELWSLNKYKLKHENHIIIENFILGNKIIVGILNNNDSILFFICNYIYEYSFKNKIILQKIKFDNYWEIIGIYITDNDEIYVNDKNKIYTLDLKNKNKAHYTLTRFNYQFENSLVILEQDANNKLFIVNSYYEIQIFKGSVYITIMQDMRYFVISYLYFILERYYSKLFNIKYINIFFIICLISFLLIDNHNKSLYAENMQNNALRISIFLYIIIQLFHFGQFCFSLYKS
jgi:hypothetical protein